MWHEARGNVLRKEFEDSMLRLPALGDEVNLRASLTMADGFHKLAQRFGSLSNVSNDGKKKIAAQLKEEAKQSFDFDMGRGYGLALLSMLFESEALPGEDAEYVSRMALQMLQAALQVYEDVSKEGLID
jgi:hypothetical protein